MSGVSGVRTMLVAVACACALGACAGRGYLGDDVDEATGAYTYTADDAAKGAEVASLGGGVEIGEGQVLVLTPDLTKGSLEVRLMDEAGETVLDEVESGQDPTTRELEPGDYSISVSVVENGTTGTLVVASTDGNAA